MTIANIMQTGLLAFQHVLRPAPPVAPVAIPAAPVNLPDGKYELRDPAAFFAGVRAITGGLDQTQVDTINRMLVGGNHWRRSWVAYALATAWH